MARGRIRIGIGGWTYEPWRGSFYPPGLPQRRELDHASRQLSSIEVNGTYYGSQKPDSFRKWHDETPDDFVFSLKGPRFATNRRVLAEAGDSVARFLDSGVLLLGRKLGPINWQFMATKMFDPEDFAAFLRLLPAEAEGRRLRHVVEVRHESFRTPAFTELARAHGVGVVIAADGPHPQIADPTADFVYARIMGTREDEALGYAPAALDLWAERARIWAAGGQPEGLAHVGDGKADEQPRDVFLYVISGFKQRNPQAAMALIERVAAGG
ncbi:DUF72 domain-containing protein [Paracoccus aminovorans]|uniref:DUF72 domain-containing protein n=1 Tax=Paracoccus aminovorans TaxID=34004 RepID=UPI002B261548|nr:DUF72 domain-containing protein [Paracoccus aminovorans]